MAIAKIDGILKFTYQTRSFILLINVKKPTVEFSCSAIKVLLRKSFIVRGRGLGDKNVF